MCAYSYTICWNVVSKFGVFDVLWGLRLMFVDVRRAVSNDYCVDDCERTKGSLERPKSHIEQDKGSFIFAYYS